MPQFDVYAKIDDHGIYWGNMGKINARWRGPVASKVALDLLYWLICLALHQRTAKAIEMVNKRGAVFVIIDIVIVNNII